MRLRRIKDYDFEPTDWTIRGDEDHTEEVSGDGSQTNNEGCESAPARSWWSDTAIIATMPDAKLRDAYHRYRALADECFHEMRRRETAGVRVRTSGSFDIRLGRTTFHEATLSRPQRSRSRKPASRPKGQQITLSPQQLMKALEMLMQLKPKEST